MDGASSLIMVERQKRHFPLTVRPPQKDELTNTIFKYQNEWRHLAVLMFSAAADMFSCSSKCDGQDERRLLIQLLDGGVNIL